MRQRRMNDKISQTSKETRFPVKDQMLHQSPINKFKTLKYAQSKINSQICESSLAPTKDKVWFKCEDTSNNRVHRSDEEVPKMTVPYIIQGIHELLFRKLPVRMSNRVKQLLQQKQWLHHMKIQNKSDETNSF